MQLSLYIILMHVFGTIGFVFNAIWGYAVTIVRKLIHTTDKLYSYVLDTLMACEYTALVLLTSIKPATNCFSLHGPCSGT
jgi:hypothetical protein